MLLLFAEIESRGSGPNTGALVGGVALLLVWVVVVVVQILRHRRRQVVLGQERASKPDETPVTDAGHGTDAS